MCCFPVSILNRFILDAENHLRGAFFAKLLVAFRLFDKAPNTSLGNSNTTTFKRTTSRAGIISVVTNIQSISNLIGREE